MERWLFFKRTFMRSCANYNSNIYRCMLSSLLQPANPVKCLEKYFLTWGFNIAERLRYPEHCLTCYLLKSTFHTAIHRIVLNQNKQWFFNSLKVYCVCYEKRLWQDNLIILRKTRRHFNSMATARFPTVRASTWTSFEHVWGGGVAVHSEVRVEQV